MRARLAVTIYGIAGLAAFAAVAYELLLASYATFLMGASIFQYSLVLSLMMASMGAGALITKKVKNPYHYFLSVEAALAILSVVALPLLYSCYAMELATRPLLLLFVLIIGTFIGMEIPLLNQTLSGADSVPNLLFFDYLGGFLGGVLFPLVLLPHLGFFRVSALLAFLNVVASFAFYYASPKRNRKWLTGLISLAMGSVFYFFSAESLRQGMESYFFNIQ